MVFSFSRFLCVLFLCTLIPFSSTLRCFVCNSLIQAECEHDYKPFLQGCPVKSFGHLKQQPAVGCRYIQQYIQEEYSIVRECAYSGSDVIAKRSKGSMGVKRIYTQCSYKHGCNGALQTALSIVPLLLGVLLRYP